MLKQIARKGTLLVRTSSKTISGGLRLLRSLVIISLIGIWPFDAPAQETSLASEPQSTLPNAPGIGAGLLDVATQSAEPRNTASISGTVLDIGERLVPGARVTLTVEGRPGEQVIVSDSEGHFTFDGLPSGVFRFTITSPGLETFVSSEIQLRAGEKHEVPQIALPVGAISTAVQVVVTQDELAEEQVKAEIQQRVFGVFPNFYTSFIWDAAPLSRKQKFELAVRSTTDPVIFGTTGIVAGVEQWRNRFPGYGDGPGGFGKRYGAAYADAVVGRMIGSAILPSLLHQDPRYFYKGSGTVRSRALYAISATFICKNDKGGWGPNYSRILGIFASGGIANLYHPAGDRGAGLTFSTATIGLAGGSAVNLIREFLLRGVTSHVPDYEKGKAVDAR